MATKKKPAGGAPAKRDTATVGADVTAKQKALDDKAHAKAVTSPTLAATFTREAFADPSLSGLGKLNWASHWSAITEICEKVNDGDMKRPEAMLIAQAMTLDAIFNRCAALAGHNLVERLPAAEALIRMALKAQGQCTQTLRVLGELKNPKSVAFIKQQNNAAGHQQVNNGAEDRSACAREESGNQSNGLLEQQHGEWLDSGAAGQAGRSNQTVETVGAVDRASDRGG
jgi:hypothetical protein